MTIAASRELYLKLKDVFNLPEKCTDFKLEFGTDRSPKITIASWSTAATASTFAAIISEYELVKKGTAAYRQEDFKRLETELINLQVKHKELYAQKVEAELNCAALCCKIDLLEAKIRERRDDNPTTSDVVVEQLESLITKLRGMQ